VGSTGIPITNFAGNVQTINQKDMPRDLQGFTDVLNQNIGSVHLNDTQGNPYNIDLMYRGFTASPILGSSQGISVFLDGMRVNEPFGDIVAWDLIPQIAIANTLVVPGSNPVYGLNTLGGAVAMTTKRGFTNEGSEAKLTLGSYNRRSIEAEKGGHSENTDYYFATSLYEDSGWATYNPSTVRQFFGKLGFMDEKRDIQFSFAYSDNSLQSINRLCWMVESPEETIVTLKAMVERLQACLKYIKHPYLARMSPTRCYVLNRSLMGCLRSASLERMELEDTNEFEDVLVEMILSQLQISMATH
jgi:outer membrane cobalamin receptor